MNLPDDVKRRFVCKIKKSKRCWTWVGGRNNKGYGMFWFGRRLALAHRVSYIAHMGAIPNGLCVLHKCDNPSCVNPEHLWLGTHVDNARDMEAKGRDYHLSGEDHPYRKNPNLVARGEGAGKAKLTNEHIPLIRRLVAEGITRKELGERFGVSAQSIGDIILGKSWTHIP